MADILEMGLEELLCLRVTDHLMDLRQKEFFHIAQKYGAFWQYDYSVASEKPGKHAELKSDLHSDVFVDMSLLFRHERMLEFLTYHLWRALPLDVQKHPPSYVAGVPNGATKLASELARMLNSKVALLEKTDNGMVVKTNIGGGTVLLIDDVCSKGTGFLVAVKTIKQSYPLAQILPLAPVVLNRGNLKMIRTNGSRFVIKQVVGFKSTTWEPVGCFLCKYRSIPIKPKATPENWIAINQSQL